MKTVLRENIFQALDTIRSHKMRSTLVILGVAIGVTTLMAMVSILSGLALKIEADVSSSDNVVVNLVKFDFLGGDVDQKEIDARPDLGPEDWDMIRNEVRSVRLVDYQQQPQGVLYLAHYQDRRTRPLSAAGVTPDFQRIYLIPLAVGRFFTQDELARNKRVCVLGKGPLEDLFPDIDPIGKRVRVRGQAYEVVGGFQSRESLFGAFADNFILVPFTTYRKDFARPNDSSIIPMVPKPGYSVDEVMGEVRGLMRGRHKLRPGQEDDFALVPADRIQGFIEDITRPIGLVLTVIASIGLMVGGIGVMAIMLVSVTERTREIGIRKAVGATRAAILGQFLTEAVTLTGIGGLAGMLAGLLVARLFSFFTGLPVAMPWIWVAISILVSAGVGLIFGMYPAAQAARLDPVDAIRHE
ncbi:MAG: ABC transporter permease [Acidobacteria bacterium]|nr:ABC transporter permease [Acidobacteriota bacterium]